MGSSPKVRKNVWLKTLAGMGLPVDVHACSLIRFVRAGTLALDCSEREAPKVRSAAVPPVSVKNCRRSIAAMQGPPF